MSAAVQPAGPSHDEAVDREASQLVGEAVWAQVLRLAAHLRSHGCEVAVSELVDAAESLAAVDLGSRSQVRVALRCTMVKHAHQGPLFDAAFDRCFGRVDLPRDTAAPAPSSSTRPETPVGDEIRRRVSEGDGDESELRVLAEEAVEAHGGFDEGLRTERYHVYRVLRAIELAKLLQDAMRRARQDGREVSRSELDEQVEALRRLITEAVRSRLLASDDLHPELAGTAHPFDVELARATASELTEVRAAIRPLARRLASRLRRRRSHQRGGAVDMKRTARQSIASGGIPFDVAYRRPRAHKPEVFSLCDVSGSVADFASFTLTLISVVADELAATRTFAFVDAVDEISDLIEANPAVIEPWQILQHGRVIGADGHSDYGAVLESFWDRYGRTAITGRSTVIVTGDARCNYRPDRAEILGEIARRSRGVYWLNPEPRQEWDTTDSVMSTYAAHCRSVFEVRTLRQLADAVERIL